MAVLANWTRTTALTVGNAPESWTTPTVDIFNFEARNDGSAYGQATNCRFTLPSTDLADGYLLVAALETQDDSNGRYQPQLQFIQQSGTGDFVGGPTGGYSRDTSEDRAYVRCWAFVNNPSASATFDVQWKADADDAGTGTTIERAEVWVIPLYYQDHARYTSTDSSLYGGTTPNQVTGFSGTDGTNISIASNVVTCSADNAKYLVLGSQFFEGRGGRTQRWHGLDIDGVQERGAQAYSYYRNGSNDENGDLFCWGFETSTANVTVEQTSYRGDGVGNLQGGANIDGSTPAVGDHALVILQLNDSAEWALSKTTANSANIATTGPVDLNVVPTAGIEFNDSASFTRASDSAWNCEQDMDVLYFANIAAASNNVSSGSRYTAYAELTDNGTEVSTSFAGDYLRNNQGSTDTFGWSANLLGAHAVSTGDDLGVSVTELAGSEGGGGNVVSPSGWSAFGLINLDSMQAAGGDTEVAANTEALTLTTNAATVTVDTTISATVAALTLTTFAASISVDTEVQAQTEQLTVTTFPATVIADTNVSANTEQLTLTTLAATVSNDVNVQVQTEGLTLTTLPASISADTDIAANLEELTLTEFPASIALDADIQANVEGLTLTTFPATVEVGADTNIAVSVEALTLTTIPADIALGVDVQAATESLSLTTLPATITTDAGIAVATESLILTTNPATVSFDQDIQANAEELTLTTYPANVHLAPRVYLNTTQTLTGATELIVESYTLDGTQVTFEDPPGGPNGSLFLGVQNTNTGEVGWIGVTVNIGGTNVAVNTEELTLTEFPATITYDVDVLANVEELTLTTQPADITYDVDVNANLEQLTLTTFPAEVTVDRNIDVNTEALTLTTLPATLTYDVDVQAATEQLTLTTFPAALDESVNVFTNLEQLTLTTLPVEISLDTTVTVDTEALTLTTLPAAVQYDVTVAVETESLTLTTFPATVELVGDFDIQVNTEQLILTTYRATVEGGAAGADDGGGSSGTGHGAYIPPVRPRDQIVENTYDPDYSEDVLLATIAVGLIEDYYN